MTNEAKRFSPPAWSLMAAVFLTATLPLRAQPLLRISLENSADHVQVSSVRRFADALSRRTEGQLEVALYTSGTLFRDRDVVGALIRGQVEMAVPGTWQLDRFEPSVGVLLLPAFYGRDREFIYRHFEGELGHEIGRRLEEATGAVVLGRWIDLGPIHLFSVNRPLTGYGDIRGLRIRYAGGIVNQMRLEAMEANPVLIPWPEFPERLARHEVDGVLTSFETVASARLWEAGIRYGFADSQYFGQYVPLVSPQFWRRLSPQLRQVIRETWDLHVDSAREDARRAQEDARKMLQANGVQIVVPSAEELRHRRTLLHQRQGEMVQRLGIDAAVVPLIPGPEDS